MNHMYKKLVKLISYVDTHGIVIDFDGNKWFVEIGWLAYWGKIEDTDIYEVMAGHLTERVYQ